jgi:hypothetical protein
MYTTFPTNIYHTSCPDYLLYIVAVDLLPIKLLYFCAHCHHLHFYDLLSTSLNRGIKVIPPQKLKYRDWPTQY